MGDAGHGLGVLGAYPSEVVRNFGEDDGGFLMTELFDQPHEDWFRAFAIVASILTVAKWNYVFCHRAGASGIGKRYPMINRSGVKQSIHGATTDRTAATEVVKSAPPLICRQGVWQPPFSCCSPLYDRPCAERFSFSPSLSSVFGRLASLVEVLPVPLSSPLKAPAIIIEIVLPILLFVFVVALSSALACSLTIPFAPFLFCFVDLLRVLAVPLLPFLSLTISAKGTIPSLLGNVPVKKLLCGRKLFLATPTIAIARAPSGSVAEPLVLRSALLAYSSVPIRVSILAMEFAQGLGLSALDTALEDFRHDCPSIGLFHTIGERGGMERTPCHRFMTPIEPTAIIP